METFWLHYKWIKMGFMKVEEVWRWPWRSLKMILKKFRDGLEKSWRWVEDDLEEGWGWSWRMLKMVLKNVEDGLEEGWRWSWRRLKMVLKKVKTVLKKVEDSFKGLKSSYPISMKPFSLGIHTFSDLIFRSVLLIPSSIIATLSLLQILYTVKRKR